MSSSVESAEENLKEAGLPEEDESKILEFKNHCFAEGLSDHRVIKYLTTLRILSKKFPDTMVDADRSDIEKVVGEIERSDKSDWTKHDYKVVLKRFFKWMNGGETYPEKVRWIKTTIRKNNHKLPEELLSQEDVERLVEAAEHRRNEALIFTLYESGCRIGELLSLKLKNVEFDEHGAKLMVDGKTGMRRVRLVAAEPTLRQWIEKHPKKNGPESPLWIGFSTTNQGKPLSYAAANKLIKKAAERAGVKKKVNPHMFRHSRATHLANHLTEAQMCEYFGWVQGSDQAAVYVHLSGRDTDPAVLQTYGIETEEKKEEEEELKPRNCPRCGERNSGTSKFCSKCGAPLDLKVMTELEEQRASADELMNQLLQDEDVKELFTQKISEIQKS